MASLDDAIFKSSPHELAVTIGLSCLAQGILPAKVLEDVYHEGQRSVTDDPQAFGLEGRPC